MNHVGAMLLTQVTNFQTNLSTTQKAAETYHRNVFQWINVHWLLEENQDNIFSFNAIYVAAFSLRKQFISFIFQLVA